MRLSPCRRPGRLPLVLENSLEHSAALRAPSDLGFSFVLTGQPFRRSASARFFRKRRGSAVEPAGSPSPVASVPAVLPPAAPRAPWPSPLSGVALSRSSVNSMRGWLFGGKTPLRALRVPGSLPALTPGALGRLASFGGLDGLRRKKPGQPTPNGGVRRIWAASIFGYYARVKGEAAAGGTPYP